MISAIAFFIWDVQPRPNVCILKQAAWVLEGTVFSEMKNNFYEMFQNEKVIRSCVLMLSETKSNSLLRNKTFLAKKIGFAIILHN